MTVGPQQFWLGTARAGQRVSFWIDTTTVHLSIGGWRIKTVPSRLSEVDLARLRRADGRPAGPPPAGPAPGALAASQVRGSGPAGQRASAASPCGNQLILVGSPLAGQRARIRLDGQLMHVITQDGVLWRTLPCPIPPGQRHRLQGVRLAGPAPLPGAATTVQRRVSCRGGIQVARQRIQVGMTHAGKIVTVLTENNSFRLVIDGETVAHRAPHHQPRNPPVIRPTRQATTRPSRTHPEGGNPMPEVRLDASDAAELAEMLQFLAGWLARDPGPPRRVPGRVRRPSRL